MRRLLLLLVVGLLWAGCGTGTDGGRPAGPGDLDKVKLEMTNLFSALEMYSHDNSLAYPQTVEALIPKYLDKAPVDPLDGKPLAYKKTERGYLIASQADYRQAGAEDGYPRMDQDGFFALKATDFPTESGVSDAP